MDGAPNPWTLLMARNWSRQNLALINRIFQQALLSLVQLRHFLRLIEQASDIPLADSEAPELSILSLVLSKD